MTAPLEPGLFHSLDPLRLAGSRCADCHRVQFPAATECATCAGGDTEVVPLPDAGTVWTWTVQRFAPKPPFQAGSEPFVPFVVGYVDLGGVLVESVLITDDRRVEIGQPVQLVRFALPGTDDAWSFAFAA